MDNFFQDSNKTNIFGNFSNDIKKIDIKDIDYKDAFDFSGVFTWDFDLKTNRIFNEGDLIKRFGENIDTYDIPESMIAKGIIEAENVEKVRHIYNRLRANETNLENEGWYHFKGIKSPVYLKIKYVIKKNYQGLAKVVHCMALDLTEIKNAEKIFSHRFDVVLRLNPNSIATYHVNLSQNTFSLVSLNRLYINPLSENVSTYDELIEKTLSLICDNVQKQRYISSFSRINLINLFNNGGDNSTLEFNMKMFDGNNDWVLKSAYLLKNPVSGDIEAVFHLTDISYKKKIDDLINGTIQREFDYVALLYINTNSYIIIDKYKNYSDKEFSDCICDFRAKFTDIIKDKRELSCVLDEFTFDNLIEKINIYGEYFISFNTTNDENNHHKVLRFSFLSSKKDIITMTCRDNTKIYNDEMAQKKAIADACINAERANKAKSEFLSLVSHDIRTPLNGIMGMLQLANGENDINVVKDYINKSLLSADFLLGLINDLLDMSKIESGKIEMHPEHYRFKDFTDYINSIFMPICQKKNLTFNFIHENTYEEIYVDKLRLNQIMFNLLSNATKYTNPGGNIDFCISSEPIDESSCILTFIVRDNGIGMTEEFQEHLFDNFSQENRMNLSKNEGTGLGLSITKRLVEYMNGEISYISELNKGTTFTVQLVTPIITEKSETFSEETLNKNLQENKKDYKENKDYTGARFLLCEDNEINQEIMIELIHSIGAEVDICNDGQIGLECFAKKPDNYYKAIFMDLRMPNMDGLTASKKIRTVNKPYAVSVPIIAMTANVMSEDKMECIDAGMNAFLAKPIDIKQLFSVMNEMIE